jgi:hypothetical protein
MRVREKVIDAGGKLTSSGARRSLRAEVGAARSATSFHYTGRALDLFVGSGMENRSRDPYGLEQGVSTFGNELLKVYSEDQVHSTPPWQY